MKNVIEGKYELRVGKSIILPFGYKGELIGCEFLYHVRIPPGTGFLYFSCIGVSVG